MRESLSSLIFLQNKGHCRTRFDFLKYFYILLCGVYSKEVRVQKNNFKLAIITTLIIFLFIIQPVSSCTIFSLYPNNQHWIGRTFDWSYGHGLVFTNKRNVSKSGLKLLPTDISGRWISKYGSITFNQFGREFPTGGMNEAGLVVEALELKSSIFPASDTRASLNELQFIQYLLDNLTLNNLFQISHHFPQNLSNQT